MATEGGPGAKAVPEPRLRGDEAFATYVVPELDVLLRVAHSLTPTTADAEDLVQDTLLRAYRSIDRFDGRYPRAWLLTIMRNAQVNNVRKKRPQLLADPDYTLEQLADGPAGSSTTEDGVVDLTFDAAVERALGYLPEKFRRVVELVDLDQLTYAEAAQVLDVPVGTVMSRLHRGRTRIRGRLEDEGITWRPNKPTQAESRPTA